MKYLTIIKNTVSALMGIAMLLFVVMTLGIKGTITIVLLFAVYTISIIVLGEFTVKKRILYNVIN